MESKQGFEEVYTQLFQREKKEANIVIIKIRIMERLPLGQGEIIYSAMSRKKNSDVLSN